MVSGLFGVGLGFIYTMFLKVIQLFMLFRFEKKPPKKEGSKEKQRSRKPQKQRSRKAGKSRTAAKQGTRLPKRTKRWKKPSAKYTSSYHGLLVLLILSFAYLR